jgi:cysteinyl-tRNA synthetase
MTSVLGVNPQDAQWASADTTAETSALDALVRSMIAQRADARAAKDWATADRIRDAIAAAGIVLEDTTDGTHWSIG